ncbi:hypothetical protein MMC07_005399 [Pseudocyphellaria aurata]|nr:hypothetical protein [Pseudocyphellaria aurata]
MVSRKAPEGVTAASAARSPGASTAPEGVDAAGAARSPGTSARRLPIPMNLVIDMVNDNRNRTADPTAADDLRGGRRAYQRQAEGLTPATVAALPPKKRATTRSNPVASSTTNDGGETKARVRGRRRRFHRAATTAEEECTELAHLDRSLRN